MKYSLSTDIHSLEDGERVVLKEFFKYSQDGDHVRRPAVVGIYHCGKRLRDYGYSSLPSDETRPHLILPDGSRFDLDFNRGEYSRPHFRDADGNLREPMWTLPLPNVGDDDAIAYVRAFRGEGSDFTKNNLSSDHEPNAVFVVDRLEDKYAVCRMVSWRETTLGEFQKIARDTLEDGSEIMISTGGALDWLPPEILDAFPSLVSVEGELALSAYDISIRRDALPDCLEIGSIIVGSRIDCNIRKGRVVTTVFTPRIAGKVDERGLSFWFPTSPVREEAGREFVFSRARDPGVPLAAVQDHLKEIERAKEKLLPNEALVLVFPPEDGIDHYQSHIVILGKRGATFFEDMGEAHDNLSHSAPEEGGLWVMQDARYWSHHDAWSGEWDGGLEGDWRPATDADLKTFGLTREEVCHEALDSYEEGDAWTEALENGTFTEEMMLLAERVCDEDRKRQEALRAKLTA